MSNKLAGDKLVKFSGIMMVLCILPFLVAIIPGVLPHGNNAFGFVLLAIVGFGVFGSLAALGAATSVIGRVTDSPDAENKPVDPYNYGKLFITASFCLGLLIALQAIIIESADPLKSLGVGGVIFLGSGLTFGIPILLLEMIIHWRRKRLGLISPANPATETDLPDEPQDPPFEPDNLHEQEPVTVDPLITRFGKMVFNASGITFVLCMVPMFFWNVLIKVECPEQIKIVSTYSFRGVLLGILIRTIGAIWKALKKRWQRDTPATETDLPHEPHDPPYEPDTLHDQ